MPASAFTTVPSFSVVYCSKYKQPVFNIIIYSFAQRISIISVTHFLRWNIVVNLSIRLHIATNNSFSIRTSLFIKEAGTLNNSGLKSAASTSMPSTNVEADG